MSENYIEKQSVSGGLSGLEKPEFIEKLAFKMPHKIHCLM